MSEIGHNGVNAEHLRQFVERAERLHEERDQIAGDLKDLFAEAKGSGYCTKTIKAVMKYRREDKAERDEREAIFDMYVRALEGN